MRAVTGSVNSSRRISIPKAAVIISRFARAGAETGARTDVAAYLRRASAAFDELAVVYREIKARRKRHEIENHGGEAEDAGRDEEEEKMDVKWRSDFDGGSENFEERKKKKKKKRELEEGGVGGEEWKESEKYNEGFDEGKKKEKRDTREVEENEVGEEERRDFEMKSERVGVKSEGSEERRKNKMQEKTFLEDGVKEESLENVKNKKIKKNKKKDGKELEEDGFEYEKGSSFERNFEEEDKSKEEMKKKKKHKDSDKDILDEERIVRAGEEDGLREMRKKKKKDKRSNLEDDETGRALVGYGGDRDRKKRMHFDGEKGLQELQKKKRRKIEEHAS